MIILNITGIITEYNPFHLGHKFHLKSCKKDTSCDAIVCIMSGNFVQRGIPAITDKWSRAKMALDSGVDLVIELPTLYAVSSAEYFAFAAISILDSLNVIDNIYFGSENGDIELISIVAKILNDEPVEFKDFLKSELENGTPFPKARAKSIERYILDVLNLNIDCIALETFLHSSNNILGIEYCKSLLKLNSNIKPYTLKREGSNYNDKSINKNIFASATAIRESIFNTNSLNSIKEFLPSSSYNILNSKKSFADFELMFNYIKYNLTFSPQNIKCIEDASEGLDNKILKEFKNCNSFNELISKCKSKRYTYTRINRILCQLFLGFSSDLYKYKKNKPDYIRVLGFSETGAKILKDIKKNSSIEIITKVPKEITNPVLNLDIKATNLYSLLNSDLKFASDYLISPIIKKN